MAAKFTGLFGSGSSAVVGASATAAIVVAAAVGVTVWRNADDPAPDPTPDEVVVEEPAQTPEAQDPVEEDVAATDPIEVDPTPPTFDVVRVDAAGEALIAGQAMAEADVTLILDGDPIEVARADGVGNFVAMLALMPSDAPRVLSLEVRMEDGLVVVGEETVIIAPFGAPEQVAVANPPEPPPTTRTDRPGIAATSETPTVETEPDGDTQIAVAEQPTVVGEDTTPEADVATAEPPAAEPPAAEAPAVIVADADGVRVVQPAANAPDAQTEIQLDAITYDVTGDVTLAGRGPAEAGVRVTLDREEIQLGEIGPRGEWSLELPDVDPGTYTLALEQVAADGTISTDVVTPFLREDPARIAENPMLVEPGAAVITVQQDFTLWGIAQANFGDGVLYIQIFEENRDQIRDPNMIFPGQIFTLPDLPRNEASTDE